jgi:hypothetical protein
VTTLLEALDAGQRVPEQLAQVLAEQYVLPPAREYDYA